MIYFCITYYVLPGGTYYRRLHVCVQTVNTLHRRCRTCTIIFVSTGTQCIRLLGTSVLKPVFLHTQYCLSKYLKSSCFPLCLLATPRWGYINADFSILLVSPQCVNPRLAKHKPSLKLYSGWQLVGFDFNSKSKITIQRTQKKGHED